MAPTTKFHMKASGECGGGGGFHLNPENSTTRLMHDAITILSLDYKYKFKLLKDRSKAKKGEISFEEAIEHMAGMIAKVVFDGSMEMFQETMKMKLVECIQDVISGGNIIPEGDVYADSVQRESRGNGSGHNSLLQRFVQLRR